MSRYVEFISAQSPLQFTIPHFLQMILDHNVCSIVSFAPTFKSEQDRDSKTKNLKFKALVLFGKFLFLGVEAEDCAQYWPRQGQDMTSVGAFQTILDKNASQKIINGVVISKLTIQSKFSKILASAWL